LEERIYVERKCYLDIERCGNERLSVYTHLEMSLIGIDVKNREIL